MKRAKEDGTEDVDEVEEEEVDILLTTLKKEQSSNLTRERWRPYARTRDDKSQIQCFNCKKFGHYSPDCLNRGTNHFEDKTNYIEKKSEEEPIILLAYKGEDNDKDVWCLDTGVSNHMCRKRSMFMELDESVNDQVTFGDRSKIPERGKENF